jgi:hypothetical protein
MPEPARSAGREAELGRLRGWLEEACEGRGSVVFLSGEPGMGRRALLEALEREEREERPESACRPTFHAARCRPQDGQLNAYQPFAELLREIVADDGRSGRRAVGKAVLAALEATAPTWLGMVPVVGAGIGATWASISQRLRESETSPLSLEPGSVVLLARELEAALGAATAEGRALVLVLARAQWIDAPSLELLAEVADFVASHPVLVVVSYRAGAVDEDHALRRRMRDLVANGGAAVLDLPPLDLAGVERRALDRLATTALPDPLLGWLLAYSGGNPLFLDGLLDRLGDPSAGVLHRVDDRLELDRSVVGADGAVLGHALTDALALPTSVEMVLEQQLEQLTEEERRLLQLGAVEGERFRVSTLVHAARADEAAIVDALAELEQDRLVREAGAEGSTFAYEFLHQLLRHRLYDSLSGPQRQIRHREIAAALEQVYGERAHRTALLDIAHHKALGGRPVEAAGYYHRAAQTADLDGAPVEARGLAQRALDLLRGALDGPHGLPAEEQGVAERLRADAILLLLRTADARWASASREEQALLVDLLEEGRLAAAEAQDAGLDARILHAEAGFAIATGDLGAARRHLESAAARSGEAGDEVARLAALIDLANVVDASDITAGRALLAEARTLAARLRAGAVRQVARQLDHLGARLDAMEGIAAADGGELGHALVLLDRSGAELARLGHVGDLPRVANYQAQAALLACDFEGARTPLLGIVDAAPAQPRSWNAYNRMLIGKTFLDEGDEAAAEPWILGGWDELLQAPNAALAAIVRLYLIELRLRERTAAVDGLIAEHLAATGVGGIGYAVAAAQVLDAERRLHLGDPTAALERVVPAVELVERSGHLPVLRTDEVHATHACCLAALGRHDDARAARERALGVLGERAASLGDPSAAARVLRLAPSARRLVGLDLGSAQPTG